MTIHILAVGRAGIYFIITRAATLALGFFFLLLSLLIAKWNACHILFLFRDILNYLSRVQPFIWEHGLNSPAASANTFAERFPEHLPFLPSAHHDNQFVPENFSLAHLYQFHALRFVFVIAPKKKLKVSLKHKKRRKILLSSVYCWLIIESFY